MRRAVVLGCVIPVVAVGAFVWHARGKSAAPAPSTGSVTSAEPARVLGVEELMRSPALRVATAVEGVVSTTSPVDQRLALIDRKEFQECGSTDCASLILPVWWSGRMPALQATVRVTGQIEQMGGKMIFIARTMEPVAVQAEVHK